MNRAFVIVLLACAALCARGQDALNAFTNRADQLLRPKWGFGVNEIPIFCSTNPLVRYNGGVHYLLQQAVNAYDQTNHTDGDFDFPSVFRPQFGVVSNDLCVTALITNWVEVTDDYGDIMARPFKTANDSTLATEDNVWGIGLIIGFKPAVPIFNEFSYANTFNVFRKLEFTRTQPATRPVSTNQMYVLSLSNVFGWSALNTWTQALPRDVTMYLTNSAAITFVNELGNGVTNSFTNGTTRLILSNQWARYFYGHTNMYEVFTNSVIPLPTSAYIERTGGFGPFDNAHFELNAGLPVHSWFVNITNQLVYALIDNSSGRILDFVNYDRFGTSLDVMQILESLPLSYPSPWLTNGADSSRWSDPSDGVRNQIAIATNSMPFTNYMPQPGESAYFAAFLNGTDGTSSLAASCPYQPSATVQQTARWWVASPFPYGFSINSPGDHFTIDEMAAMTGWQVLIPIANSASLNPLQNPGDWPPIQITQFASDSTNLTLQFSANTDGQYGVWSSSDLVNWGFAGVAAKLTNNVYGFSAPVNGDATNLYFQARKF